jgi:hypothetical protein
VAKRDHAAIRHGPGTWTLIVFLERAECGTGA